MTDKGPAAFRSISEASVEVGVPSHVLRFWETRFAFVRPMKRAGGRRFYRPQDLEVLRRVRTLLHDDGYTIKGVQKLHREGGVARLMEPARAPASADPIAPVADSDRQQAFDAAQADLFPPLASARPEGPRFVLAPAARHRLRLVLDDLEGVKSIIDALIAHPRPTPPSVG